MLSFIGIGGAFATDLGNCSAFFRENDKLILIDCGENIFEQILNLNLLNKINRITIVLTHFHSDHVGSLGSLLFYCDKIGINDVNIIYPNQKKLEELIYLFGVQKCNFKILKPIECTDFYIKEICQKHSFMEAYGYLIILNEKVIYYSGDTKSIDEEIVTLLLENKIDYFYQDVRKDLNDYHISIEELSSIIPKKHWDKINCMHFNSFDEMKEIEKRGFSRVKKIGDKGYGRNI